MQFNLESNENHSIQAYSEDQIQINGLVYKKTFLVTRNEISKLSNLKTIEDIDDEVIAKLIERNPEVIIIGHKQQATLPISALSTLSQQRIGVEAMSIGAACRTYNVLLSEGRAVLALMIF